VIACPSGGGGRLTDWLGVGDGRNQLLWSLGVDRGAACAYRLGVPTGGYRRSLCLNGLTAALRQELSSTPG
jgi:hypothetical protein